MSEIHSAMARFDGPLPGVPGALVREVDALPDRLPGGVAVGPSTEAAPGALLFEVPGVARYLIRDGATIDVAVAAGADRDAAALFLHSSAAGALMHQRGDLPVSATTLVSPKWACVAICGPSAYGKSTIAMALCRRGWRLVADGITRISWNGTSAIAWPNTDRLQLWRDACDRFGLDFSRFKQVRAGLEKYYVPAEAVSTPAALALAVRLRITDERGIVEFAPEDGAALLSVSTMRLRQVDALGRREAHRHTALEAARSFRAVGMDGARRRDVEELADVLEEAVQ